MPTIIYITTDGVRHEVEVENGYSVMEGAINNDIDGIENVLKDRESK